MLESRDIITGLITNMIVFIDESGDAGFKLQLGSTPVFVIALIIFDDELEAEETALKIKKLKRELHKSDSFEFKFNKLNKNFRVKFFETIRTSKFRVRAIVFKKENIYSLNLREDKNKFYNYAVKLVLKNNNKTIESAKIRLDGLGERAFRRSLQVYLRQELNRGEQKVLKSLRFRDSSKDVLIQLADMVAGAIRRSYDDHKTDASVYRNQIKKLLEDVWEFK